MVSLAEAGWLVQLREEINRDAGLGVAAREFPTGSGPVDYALFVGGTLCGVVEAKPEGATLSGFADQAARYMGGVPEHLVRREGQVRFEYVASGIEILLRDHADPAPRSRRVFFFHRPEALRRWLAEPMTIRRRLQTMRPLVTERLRDCQIDAVRNLEASLASDHPRALIQMATGAGKTYTACVFSHRLLDHAKFRRVLSLADRANLVRQTRHEFEDFRPPGTGRSCTELYNVQRLGPVGLDKDAVVVIATIQRVYALLTGRELSEEDEERSGLETGGSELQRVVQYNPAIPIEAFDLIITDECHRSIYGTWRQVLENFNAFIVRLTATPSLHTMGFFGSNLVADYPYERSVTDGVNVPYEIYRIRTDIGEHGGAIPKGPRFRSATNARAPSATRSSIRTSPIRRSSSTARSSCQTRSAPCSKPIATACLPSYARKGAAASDISACASKPEPSTASVRSFVTFVREVEARLVERARGIPRHQAEKPWIHHGSTVPHLGLPVPAQRTALRERYSFSWASCRRAAADLGCGVAAWSL